MTFKTVNSIAFYLHYWKSAKQYGDYTLQLKDVKDKDTTLWNAKSIGGNNELRLDETACLRILESGC
jgi:hypothetical protein